MDWKEYDRKYKAKLEKILKLEKKAIEERSNLGRWVYENKPSAPK